MLGVGIAVSPVILTADLREKGFLVRAIKKLIKDGIRATGHEVRVYKLNDRKINAMSYGRAEVLAQYLPWLDDSEFLQIRSVIQNYTLVDRIKCHELWQLIPQVIHLPGDILEVGVWRGGTGALISYRAPSKKVFLADTFRGVVKAGENDASYFGGEHSDTSVEIVQDLVSKLGCVNTEIMVGIFPDDFETLPEKYCFVHIDVDVHDSARDIMTAIWPALSVGGMVVFDDYGSDTANGITHLVNTYRGDIDKVVIHNMNGHAVVVKIAASPTA
jgi:O-methyltransferase